MSLILASMLLFAHPQGAAETTEPRLMRFPAIHDNTVVFTYAGDIWVANIKGGLARRLTSHPNLETRAKFSPDGKTIAFTGSYDGNPEVYTIPIEGGEPKRLTFDALPDSVLGWTPDGKNIAYGTYYGADVPETGVPQQAMDYVPAEGGLPVHTRLKEVTEASWFPDGDTIAYTRSLSYLFNWRHYRGGTQGRISFYQFSSNKYWEIPSGREQSYFPMMVGRSVFYTSDKNLNTQNLYRYDLDSKKISQLTNFNDADIRWPSTDGKTIVYERDGYLWLYDIAGGDVRKFNPLIASENLSARPFVRNLAGNISSITLSPSGIRLAVEARGELFSVPVKSGDTRNITNSPKARERFPQWSPDGQTIAYVSDASGEQEVYTQPQLGGTPTQLTHQGLSIGGITWSPDGKTIGIQTDTNELWTLDVAAKKITRVVKSQYGLSDWDWSPDGKWIALVDKGKNLFGSLYLYELATAKMTRVTDGQFDDTHAAWDLNGKYLYLASNRTFAPNFGQFEFSLKVENSERIYLLPLTKDLGNPLLPPVEEEPSQSTAAQPGGVAGVPGGGKKPMPSGENPTLPGLKIDFDGLGERLIPLPMPATMYFQVIGGNGAVMYYATGGLTRFDVASRETQVLLAGPPAFYSFNPGRTKMAYNTGGLVGVVNVMPGQQVGAGKVDTSSVESVLYPRDEWNQMFWEAWRFERDHYYDPTFRGLDWKAIGQRYSQYLKYVNHRTDLNYVIGLMISELGTGHSYVSGGDNGPVPPPLPVGELGADYETAGDHLRFKKIYRGQNFYESDRAPLAEPGVEVHEGDYLLAIDDKPVTAQTPPSSFLLDKVNKGVILTVNGSPSMTGARKVRVRPIGNEVQVRYDDWFAKSMAHVAKRSEGRIGYIHVPNTNFAGAIGFIKGFYSQTDKDAVIVDERWNGGGFIQPWFVDTLARKARAGIQNRNALDTSDAVAIEGPKAMLINGYSGSGGDFFPWMFRQAGLGPLIGKRTWGGLVGIGGGDSLVDGGNVTAPEFAIFDRETGDIIAENRGVDPDMDVDNRPDIVWQGKDPQLDAAIDYLLDQLKKHPPRKARVKFPQVGKEGQTGAFPPLRSGGGGSHRW